MTSKCDLISRDSREHGFVMLLMSLVLASVGILVFEFTSRSSSSRSAQQAILQQRQTFYAADGARSIITQMAGTYITTDPNPTADKLSIYLNGQIDTINAQLGSQLASGFSVDPIQVNSLGTAQVGTIQGGPFNNYQAEITPVAITSTVRGLNGNPAMTRLSYQANMADIFLFQFMHYFSAPLALQRPGTDTVVGGNTYAAGDLCLAPNASTMTFLGNVSVAGRLMYSGDPRCGWTAPTPGTVQITTDGTASHLATFDLAGDNGCTNCDGTTQSWADFARSRWNGYVSDSALGTPKLILPGKASDAAVQDGASSSSSTSGNSNMATLRMLLDPPSTTDSTTVQGMKFSVKADIRIIDGVWFLKDPSNPYSWPGIPIWSDHPGHADLPSLDANHPVVLNVGQDDIRAYWQTLNPWPVGATPHGYSYYEYDPVLGTLTSDLTGVISYGSLAKVAGQYTPGFFFDPAASNAPMMCPGSSIAIPALAGLYPVSAAAVTCTNPAVNPPISSLLLTSTRSGFRDAETQAISAGPAAAQLHRSDVYPTNFDVGQFQAALSNTSAGELGSYFGAGRFMGSAFNGVVYISSSWPGSLDGFTLSPTSPYVSSPLEAPFQDSISDTQQIGTVSSSQQSALPYPLCSNAVLSGGHAGLSFDQNGLNHLFVVPDCANYNTASATPILAFPNVVRIFNGAALSSATLPTGLSISTNLPTYLMGDYNVSSNIASATATPWVSTMIGADIMSLLSNNWDDAQSPWNVDASTTIGSRIATNTTYTTSILTGNGANDNLIENWTGKTFVQNGAIVEGFYPVFVRRDAFYVNWAYTPPTRQTMMDPHLATPANQPPGTPFFLISALQSWKEQ